MFTLHIILRIIHIFAGAFWVGVSFLTVGLLTPAVARMGPEGGRFMQTFVQKTQLSKYMGWAALLTTGAGILLYIIDSSFRPAWIASGMGIGWTIGGLAGIVAFLYGMMVTGRVSGRMEALGQQIAAAGGPPSSEQAAEMQALSAKLRQSGQVSLALVAITLLAMVVARNLPF